MSKELVQANRDREQLRDANAQLTTRLVDMQQQRVVAIAEAQARPTFEAVQSMQEELSVAKEHLAEAQSEHQETLQQLSEVQQQRESEQEIAAQDLASALAAAEQAPQGAAELPHQSAEDSGVDYDPELDNVEVAEQVLEDHLHDFVIDEEPVDEDAGSLESDQLSDWNLESPAPAENPVEGSLANMLIHDLDQEAHGASSETEHDAEGIPPSGWDQEHGEEAYATHWSNHSDGYRVEEIEQPEDRGTCETGQGDAPIAESRQDAIRAEADPGDEEKDDSISAESPAETAAAVSVPEDGSEEDDSIEAYMNRLLRRAQGQPIEAPPAATEAATQKSNEEGTDHEALEEPETPDPNTPLEPRSKAPEGTTSLSAMRDLANASARTAISHSVRVQTRNIQLKGVFSLACAAGALACGIACYFFIPGVMRYLAVAMTAVVACIYVQEGWQRFREASRQLKEAELGSEPSTSTVTEDQVEQNSRDEAPTS